MDTKLRNSFRRLLKEENLDDPSWVLELDTFDEPPLFTRNTQVEFLHPVPGEQRPIVALEVALSLIEGIADAAARHAPDRSFFVCVTLSDFDSWRAGGQLIPTLAIYVDPNVSEPTPAALRLMNPYSAEGLETAKWLAQLGEHCANRYCVGELSTGAFDPELMRVYVGWRNAPSSNVRSVGSDLSSPGS